MQTEPRKSPNLMTKLASTLLALEDIPYTDAKLMSAEQMISLYHFDHNIRHAEDGTIDFWNLTPRLIVPHREKTTKVDVPAIAKGKRIRKKAEKFTAAMLAKNIGEPIRQKPRSRIKSRGFDKTRSRTFSGKVVRR